MEPLLIHSVVVEVYKGLHIYFIHAKFVINPKVFSPLPLVLEGLIGLHSVRLSILQSVFDISFPTVPGICFQISGCKLEIILISFSR